MIISAREPLGSVSVTSAAGAFALATIAGSTTGIPLNPIFGGFFPRLSTIALAYEHFKFKKFRLDFMSSQPTTAAGQILAWVDYAAIDVIATTSSEALSNITSVIANIYSSVSCLGLGSLSRLPKYVINVNVDANVEQTMQGVMYLATQGYVSATSSVIGELMVEYEIELFTPSQIVGSVLLKKVDVEMAKQALWNIQKSCDSESCHIDTRKCLTLLGNSQVSVNKLLTTTERNSSIVGTKQSEDCVMLPRKRTAFMLDPDNSLYRNTVNEKSTIPQSRRSSEL
jgi:hypothetical protein